MASLDECIVLDQESNRITRRHSQRTEAQNKGRNSPGDKSKARRGSDSGDTGARSVEYELKKLTFANPGKIMEEFSHVGPEKSGPGRRRVKRKIYKESIKKNQLYDDTGLLLENSEDLCDCLDKNCPGCHFPCPKCGSEKCGTECRCNRKWVFEYVHVEGTELVFKWPT